jgi:hypothetical protein
MWGEQQRHNERANESHGKWDWAFQEYRRQLAVLRNRMDGDAFSFFDEADLHDGELLEFRIIDGSRPAPLSAPVRRWGASMYYPVRAELSVLDAMEQFAWHVSYSALRRTVINFPGEEVLFYQAGERFGDWAYDELTDVGDGFLRHEILFASGSILAVEFRNVSVSKTPARAPSWPA